MSRYRFLLVARDLAIGETGEKIVTLVVFLHMLEAEHEILPLGIAADGCAMNALLVAAVPLTGRGGRLCARLDLAPGPNAIEVF
ncbi:hypothetical protein D3C72_2367950 [compost metagenome]